MRISFFHISSKIAWRRDYMIRLSVCNLKLWKFAQCYLLQHVYMFWIFCITWFFRKNDSRAVCIDFFLCTLIIISTTYPSFVRKISKYAFYSSIRGLSFSVNTVLKRTCLSTSDIICPALFSPSKLLSIMNLSAFLI